jgi:hypothetical protein
MYQEKSGNPGRNAGMESMARFTLLIEFDKKKTLLNKQVTNRE